MALKTVEFWGHTKRRANEMIDQYYHRFHELLDDLLEVEEPISTRSAIRQFIFTLGPEFEQIQNNYRINNLPANWATQDWPTILVLCRNYFNSVKPQGVSNKDPSGDSTNQDRAAQQKKVRNWFLNSLMFCREIEKEQSKFPNMCIYHLRGTHSTDSCSVKKACERQSKQPKESGPKTATNVSSSTGQLRHITEETFKDAIDENAADCQDEVPNDTNDEVLNYFERVSRHYLRLVNGSSSPISKHPMKYPIIADSGANYHMFKELIFFDTLLPATGKVLLGDGKTSLAIQGVGTVKLKFGDKFLCIPNVRYIPDLSESVYSLFVHIKCPEHSVSSSYEDGLFITFPEFNSKVVLGCDDIYLDAVPGLNEIKCTQFVTSPSISSLPQSICRQYTLTKRLMLKLLRWIIY